VLEWLLGGFAVFTATLSGAACFVALFGMDKSRRESGFRVLKLLWISVSGSGGVIMLAVRILDANPI
jgi:hypothetical protein